MAERGAVDHSREIASLSPLPEFVLPNSNALFLFGYLQRRGGSMRIGALLRRSGLDCEALIAAIKELHERRWVNVDWRQPRSHMPPDFPERFREVERITTTRFGRHRFPGSWSTS